jgi:hypothetical protein
VAKERHLAGGARKVTPPTLIIAVGARKVLTSKHIMAMGYCCGARKVLPPKHIIVVLLAKCFRQRILRSGVLQWSSQSASLNHAIAVGTRKVLPPNDIIAIEYCSGARKVQPSKHSIVALLAKSPRENILRSGVLQWSSQNASVEA